MKVNCDTSEKVYILLENESQVKNYMELQSGDCIGKIVALSPFAAYELENKGISYSLIEDFYDENELYELGINNYAKMESICKIIDAELKKNIFPEQDISPALFNYYTLKLIYDSITIRLFQLSRLIHNELPDKLMIYESTISPLNTDGSSLLFDNEESIYSHLLSLTGWDVHIEILSESINRNVIFGKKKYFFERTLKSYLEALFYNNPSFYELATIVKHKKSGELVPFIKNIFNRKKGSVLMLDAGYNWNACTHGFKEIGLNTIYRIPNDIEYWSTKNNKTKLSVNIFNDLKENHTFRDFFTCGGIDFFPLIETRLYYLITHLTFISINAYRDFKRILIEKDIRVVLASTLSTCVQQSFAKAAHSLNIPIVAWQHGNYGYYDQPMIVYKDIAPVDYLFLFGEGVRKKYEKEAKKYNCTLIPIGSILVEQIPERTNQVDIVKNIGDPYKKNVLFVVTNYYQNDLYITSPPPYSDNKFWEIQKSVLDTFSKYDEYNFIIKLHPSSRYRESPMLRYVEENGIENIRFLKDEYTFIDLLSIADLIIIDFPSTTLLQSLTTKKPLIVYDGHNPIDKEARILLKHRASCYSSNEEFIDAVNDYLFSGKVYDDINLDDNRFLELYGTGYNDESTMERAIIELEKILKSTEHLEGI